MKMTTINLSLPHTARMQVNLATWDRNMTHNIVFKKKTKNPRFVFQFTTADEIHKDSLRLKRVQITFSLMAQMTERTRNTYFVLCGSEATTVTSESG